MSENIYLKIGLLVLAFGLWAGFSPVKIAAQKNSKSLCEANEQTIWSCSTVKNKLASVCASKDLTADSGYVQYRFGILGKIELEFPKDRDGSQKAFKYSRYTRPLVTMLRLSFENAGVVYEIHDDDNAEEKPPVRATYIEVQDGGKISTLQCRLPDAGSLMNLEDIVLRDEEN